jgi:hypothetical protein
MLVLAITAPAMLFALPASADHCGIGNTHWCSPFGGRRELMLRIGVARIDLNDWCYPKAALLVSEPGLSPATARALCDTTDRGAMSQEELTKLIAENKAAQEELAAASIQDEWEQPFWYTDCDGEAELDIGYQYDPPYEGSWATWVWLECKMRMDFIRIAQRVWYNNAFLDYLNSERVDSSNAPFEFHFDNCKGYQNSCRGEYYKTVGANIILPYGWYWTGYANGCKRGNLGPRELECEFEETFFLPSGSQN